MLPEYSRGCALLLTLGLNRRVSGGRICVQGPEDYGRVWVKCADAADPSLKRRFGYAVYALVWDPGSIGRVVERMRLLVEVSEAEEMREGTGMTASLRVRAS
eukprot:2831103-Rhodomonas_salina.1